MNKKKILILSALPSVFTKCLKNIFPESEINYFTLRDCVSGDEFCTRFLSCQPNLILISFGDYIHDSEFYDDLLESFPNAIFWKIPKPDTWHKSVIEDNLRGFKGIFLRKQKGGRDEK